MPPPSATAREARLPDHRLVRRCRSRSGARDDAPGDRARRAARVRQRLGAPPAPAVRHLLARRRAGRRHAADPAHRAGHGRHPARLGEPAAAGRGPRDRRRAVRRPAQPGRQRRAADALRRGPRRALPRHRRHRGLQLRARAAAAAVRRGRAGEPVPRPGRHRGLLRPGRAALPRPARPDVVRRGQPAVGAVGGGERAELPVEQRRAGRGVGGLRRDPAVAPGDVPGAPPGGRGGPRVAGARRDPDRRRDGGAAGEVRGVRRGPHPADRDAAGASADDVRPGHHGHGRPDRRDALRGPGVPAGPGGRVRAAVQLRP